MKKAVVVGSGAGGATVARELQGKFDVTVLEAGGSFVPFSRNLGRIEAFKKTGLLFDEREIQWLFPNMVVRRSPADMVMVNGAGLGGTTAISAGNAVRSDEGLKAIGVNLDAEFDELRSDIPANTDHMKRWRDPTLRAYDICNQMGLDPVPTPKMLWLDKCRNCGRCVLGCPSGAKWDSRVFLDEAVVKGAEVVSRCKVQKVAIRDGRAGGVYARVGHRMTFFPADLVVVAAGGFGTFPILERSGIKCEPHLFVDPVLCVAARWDGAFQNREMPMPFIVQKDRYMISPYFDFLSFYFNRRWKYQSGNIFSLMIKLADDNSGTVDGWRIKKGLTHSDREAFDEGVHLCREILSRLGRKPDEVFLGTVNAGHPGGSLPLTEKDSETFHNDSLPENLYVADATLLPRSSGRPLILTICALAKRIAKVCAQTQ